MPATSQRAPALESLVRLSSRLLSTTETGGLVDDLLDALLEASGGDAAAVLLFEGGRTAVRSARGSARAPIDLSPHLPESAVRRLREERRAILLEAGRSAAEPGHVPAPWTAYGSAACAPLTQRGELLGALWLGAAGEPSGLAEGALEALTVFAALGSLLLQSTQQLESLRREYVALKEAVAERQFGDLIGAGPGMREVFRRIEKVAATDVSVLVTGETGTGKEVVAREIHRRSLRAGGPFVAINCGAIPADLLESELFGHAKGSFTGATANRQGRFQAASGGTLFLDEIGEMPPSLQIKLLRALQERAVTRLGDAEPEPVDIRVIAATHKVLEEEIARGAFREDLYYRLNVVAIRLPPLRERLEDVPVFARYFLQRYGREFGARVRGFAPPALAAMKKYGWPGNIRELENRVKKAVVLAERALVGPEDLDLRPEELDPIVPLAQAKDEFQRRYINDVLERNAGNRTKTAKDLGVDPRTIFRHLEKLEGTRGGGRPPDAPR